MKRAKREEVSEEIIGLNVGGLLMDCSLTTLTKLYPDSHLADTFSEEGRFRLTRDSNDRYFLDTDGNTFSQMIHYMRRSIPFSLQPPTILKEVWQAELEYWGLLVIPPMAKIPQYTEERMDKTIGLLVQLTDMEAELLKGSISTTVYIPHEGCEMEWGQSLFDYIRNAESLFTARLAKLFPFQASRLELCSTGKTTSKEYTFNNIKYKTHETKTMKITIIRLF